MPAIRLRRRYVVGATYGSQKSPAGNGSRGKANKKSNKRVKKSKELLGRKILLIDMSGVPKFCASTGKKLPVNGMVVEYNGAYYADFKASARANS